MSNFLSELWTALAGLATKDAEHYTYITLPQPSPEVPVIKADEHYFQLRMVDMFLSKGRTWFTDWHPAVTSQVKLKFGARDATPICRVASPPHEALSPGVFVNYPLTDLLPYRGGEVDVQAGLLGLKGASAWTMPIALLERFSGLVGAPLAASLAVAEQVAGGLNELLAKASERVHLGFHQAFTPGGAPFVSSYHIIVGAPDGKIEPAQLSIEGDRLRYQETPHSPKRALDEYDYIVIAIDGVVDRKDFEFPDIESAMLRAKEALKEPDLDAYEKNRRAAIAAALSSPDLVEAARTRVVAAIKSRLKAAGDAYNLSPVAAGIDGVDGATGAEADSAFNLTALVTGKSGLSRTAARDRGPYTLAEAFAD